MWYAHVGTGCRGLAFTPDGRFLLATNGKGVSVWDVATRAKRELVRRFLDFVTDSFALVPDGGRLLVVYVNERRRRRYLGFYDIEATSDGGVVARRVGPPAPLDYGGGVLVLAAAGHEAYFWSRADSLPDRLRLPAAGDGGPAVRLLVNLTLYDNSHSVAAANPAATLLVAPVAAGREREAVIWDTVGDREVRTLTLPGEAATAALADSGHVAFGLEAGHVQLFDPAGVPTVRLKAARSFAVKATFSPAGPLLATHDAGPAVTLWHRDTGERVASYDWQLGTIRHAAFSPDGLTLAVAGTRRASAVVFDLEV